MRSSRKSGWRRAAALGLSVSLLWGGLASPPEALAAGSSDSSKLAATTFVQQLLQEQEAETWEKREMLLGQWTGASVAGDTYGVMAAPMGAAAAGTVEKISIPQTRPNNTGHSKTASVSEDGRWVAFESTSSSFDPSDNTSVSDVFIYDRDAGSFTRVPDPSISPYIYSSFAPSISLDGRYVLFASEHRALAENNGYDNYINLYRYDRETKEIRGVAEGVSEAASETGRTHAISADGRYAAFWSYADNGLPGDYNGYWDLFVKDIVGGLTTRITDHDKTDLSYPYIAPYTVWMTSDGQFIGFDADQADLAEGDGNGARDAFVYDAATGAVDRASLSSGGIEGNGASTAPSLSADGRYTAFLSEAANLIGSGPADRRQAYIRDRQTGTTQMIPPASIGSGDSVQGTPVISANGRYVVYTWSEGGQSQIYRYDREAGVSGRMSNSSAGEAGSGSSAGPHMTDNGRYLVYASTARNLGEEPDSDDYFDIYWTELNPEAGLPPAWSAGAALQHEAVGGSYVYLSWPAAVGAEEPIYRVDAVRSSDGSRQVAAITKRTEVLVTGLDMLENYEFQVRADNGSYAFDPASMLKVNVSTTLPETIPTSPVGNLAATLALGKLLVSWDEPGDRDFVGVRVAWRMAGEAAYRELPFLLAGTRQAELSGIVNSKLYDVSVVAVDAEGNESAAANVLVSSMEGVSLERISVSASGEEMYSMIPDYWGETLEPSTADVSGDGRYVVFSGHAGGLLPEAEQYTPAQIFLYDRQARSLRLISYRAFSYEPGEPDPGYSASWQPRISGDGRYIVFLTDSAEIVGYDDAELAAGVALYDRDADGNGIFDEPDGVSTTLLSPYDSTYGADNERYADPVISSDGAKVLFRTANPDDSSDRVYLYEEETLTELTLASGRYTDLAVSGDGNSFAVSTTAQLDAAGPNAGMQLYLIQLANLQAERIEPPGTGALSAVRHPAISADARYVAFTYTDNESTGPYGVYVYDRTAQTMHTVAASAADDAAQVALSGDGSLVVYTGKAEAGSGTGSGTSSGIGSGSQILAYDPATGERQLLSVSYTGAPGNGASTYPAVSDNGAAVVFTSESDNLMTGDKNGIGDIFYVELAASQPEPDVDPPVWPAGAKLEVMATTHESVTLAWTPAQDANGIATYRIYKDGEPAATAAGAEHTATVSALQPLTSYVFSVEAVDPSGNSSQSRLSAAVETLPAPTNTDLRIYDAKVTAPQPYRSYVGLGEALTVTVKGDAAPEISAEALVEYRSADGETKSETVAMPEASPNVYQGRFETRSGMTEIVKVTALLTDGENETEQEALLNPLYVGGSLLITLDEGVADSLHGGYLKLSNPALNVYAGVKLDQSALSGQAVYEVRGLPAASGGSDYEITAADSAGYEMVLDQSSVQLGLGAVAEYAVSGRLPTALQGKVSFSGSGAEHGAALTIQRGSQLLYSGEVRVNDSTSMYGFGGLYEGDELKLIVTPREPIMKETIVTKRVLGTGVHNLDIEVLPRAKMTLSGQVLDAAGNAVEGALVTVHQTTAAEPIKFQTVSDAQGMYALEVYEGKAVVGASKANVESSQRTELEMIREAGPVQQVNISFLPQAFVQLDIYTRQADGEWIGPLQLDWRELGYWAYTASHRLGGRSLAAYPGNQLPIYAMPGDTVEMCVDGRNYGLPGACGSTVLDEQNTSRIELRVEQINSFVQGQVQAADGNAGPVTVELYAVDEHGRGMRVDKKVYGSTFRMAVHEPGDYQLYMSNGRGFAASRPFTAHRNETVELGLITLMQEGVYGGHDSDDILFSPAMLIPGEQFQVRIRYKNTDALETADTKLLLPIPAGMRLADHGVVKDGQPVEAGWIEAHTAIVDLGTVPAGQEGIVAFYLRLDDDYAGELVSVLPRMAYSLSGRSVEEPLGSRSATVVGVTLDAPEMTGLRNLAVSGMAPPGSFVRIYDQEQLIGETLASVAGKWKAVVHLEGDARQSIHRLYAEAELHSRFWASEDTVVTVAAYDQDYPEVVEAAIMQPKQKKITFYPGDGVAIFPYTYVAFDPFQIMLTFRNSEQVSNVKVQIGNGPVTALHHAGNGMYWASMWHLTTGPIWVSYDVKQQTTFAAKSGDEAMLELPAAIQEMELSEVDVAQSESDPYNLRVSYDSNVRVKDYNVGLSGRLSTDLVDYPLTELDARYEETTGIPVYGFSLNYSMTSDQFSFSLTGYIPEEKFREGGEAAAAQQLFAALGAEQAGIPAGKEKGAVTTAAVVKQVIKAVKTTYTGTIKPHGKTPWDIYEFYDDVSDTLENRGKLDQLEELLRDIESGCAPAAASPYRKRADDIAKQYMAHEIVKWAMIAGAAAAAPSTFGLGTLLLFAASEGVEKLLDDKIDRQIEDLRKQIKEDRDCEEPEDKPKEKKRKKIADPKWVHDPSGYVYEVEPGNRIEGVTATALYWEEAGEYWQVWDAEWYGQLNPQTTNREGRYAWDVPEGLWKVVYEKDGYALAESDELPVLPPHFDVNIPMDSLLPPEGVRAQLVSVAESVYAEFTLNRHADVATVNETMVALTGITAEEEELDLQGPVEAVGTLSYKGRDVARTFRYRLPASAPLNEIEAMTLRLQAGVQSYNGVPMTEPAMLDVMMTDLPPGLVTEVKTAGTLNGVFLEWTDPADSDFTEVRVFWKESGAAAIGEPVAVPGGEQFAVIAGLRPSTSYDLVLQAVDEGGLHSDYTLTVRTAETAAAPDFEPPLPIEQVEVEAGAAELRVTWTEPEPAGDLEAVRVGWIESGSGLPTVVTEVFRGIGKYTITGLKPATEYEVTVNAVDAVGNYADGVLVLAMTLEAPSSGGENPDTGGEEPGSGYEGPDTDSEEPGADDEGTGSAPGSGGVPGGSGENTTPGNGSGGGGMPGTGVPQLPGSPSKYAVSEQGGEIEAFDGKLRLTVPPRAFPAAAELAISTSAELRLPGVEGWKAASGAYRMEESRRLRPQQPIWLTLVYDPQLLEGADPLKLGIYRENPDRLGSWQYVGGKVRTERATIEAEIDELGTYAVLLYDPLFEDLAGHWSRSEVEVLISRQLVQGVGNRQFVPDRDITRAELTKLLVEILAEKAPEKAAGAAGVDWAPEEKKESAFVDVAPEAWYFEAVMTAASWGLAQGDQGRFRPDDPITRQEMAVLVMRAARLLDREGTERMTGSPGNELQSYADTDEIAIWAYDAFASAVRAELILGLTPNQLRPEGTATRAQSAVVLYRLLAGLDRL